MVEVRASADGGYTWGAWEQYTIERTTSPAEYILPVYRSGILVECRIYTVGDGSKRMSEPSNTVQAVALAEPASVISILKVKPFFINGGYKTQIIAGINTSLSISWHGSILRKDVDFGEWEYGWLVGSSLDERSYNGGTFAYKVAAMTANGLISEYTDPVQITLPDKISKKLLPPTPVYTAPSLTYYYDGEEYVRGAMIYLMLGDRRATVVHTQWQYNNNGIWHDYNEYGFIIPYDKQVYSYHVDDYLFSYLVGRAIEKQMTANPQTGDVIKFRFKNSAYNTLTHEGDLSLEDSDWGEEIEYIYPDYSGKRLAAPTVEAYQKWQTTYITITWNAIANATGYKIEKTLTGSTEWRVLVESTQATEHHDYEVDEVVRYKYRVTALGDGTNYYDSFTSNEAIAYIQEDVDLDPPTIVSATEVDRNGEAKINLVVEDIDTKAIWIMLEYTKDGGAWTEYSMLGPGGTYTLQGDKVKYGGAFTFRCYAVGGTTSQSEYSNTVSVTLKERVYFWDSATQSDPSGLTGGWESPTIVYSDSTVAGGVSVQRQSDGSMKTYGNGFWMTRNPLATGSTSLSSIYSRICMTGTLVKESTGTEYCALFGSGNKFAWDSSGTSIGWDWRRSTSAYSGVGYVYAGSQSGRGNPGSLENPGVAPVSKNASNIGRGIGTFIAFELKGGYAKYTAIFGIKV